MLRVGIAGIGFMGKTHFEAYQKIRGVKVTAICEQDPRRLAGDWRSIKGNFGSRGRIMDLSGIRRYQNLEDINADAEVDLLDVCLPPDLHARISISALRAGKHVFCEKPIALRAADAEAMVRAADKAGRRLLIGHVLPFFPEYQYAYQVIREGKYGAAVGGHFRRIVSDPLWLPNYYDPKKVGGPMLDLHVHDAHFIRLIFGMPQAVSCLGTMRGKVAERFSTQFFFRPARMVTAESGVIDQQGRPFTHAFEIYLEKATLFFEYASVPKVGDVVVPLTVLLNDGKTLRPKLGSGDPTDAFVAELSEMVRAVRTGTPSPILEGEPARDALILCYKQSESLRRGRPVEV